jgi:hypothetical protein
MEKETLKSLRAKAKELRSKVSSAPLSKATPDQLRSEILMLERAVKAEEKALERKALKMATAVAEKKKITKAPVTATVPKVALKKDATDTREKELAKREKELAKREKMMMVKKESAEDTSDSDDY